MSGKSGTPGAADGRGARRREVVFVKYFQKGSTDIAADQMAEALQRRGLVARSLPAAEIGAVRDAILIFVKRADLLHLLGARRRGNALVLDVHDTIVFKRGIRYRSLYDGLIFRTRRALADFGGGKPGGVVIPHHWDERYRPHHASIQRGAELKVAFIGHPRSWPFEQPIPGVELVVDDWFRRAVEFNAHLSVRRPGREALYKPNLKVATAAACNAVLLTTPDESAVESLGAGYPFYVGWDAPSVVEGLRRAERMLGGAEWRQALARLAEVRAETTLDRITDLYVEYLQRFGELAELDAEARSAVVPRVSTSVPW